MQQFITCGQVAKIMEFANTQMFTKRRADLIENHGFPHPVPFIKRPMKFRRDDVENWLKFAGQTGADGRVAFNGRQSAEVIMFNKAAKG